MGTQRAVEKLTLPDLRQSSYHSSRLPSFPLSGFNTALLAHRDAVWEGGNHPISLEATRSSVAYAVLSSAGIGST
jgi:hypothetical protein